jgi:uncharacterized protein (PEP-CTERM system associated)
MRRALITGLIGLTTVGMATAQQQQGIVVTPSIGVSNVFTDNAAGGEKAQADLVTQLTPSLTVAGETPRIKVNFTYQPTFNHFDVSNSPDTVDQNLNTQGTITPITDLLTIDFQGNASEAGASGNSSNQQGILIPSANRVLYYIGTISPHFQDHIGSFATIDAYLGINSVNTSVQGSAVPGFGVSSTDQLGLTEEIAIGSADTFGRLGLKLDAKHSSTTGSGLNTASTSSSEGLSAVYHLNRVYALSASIGKQSIDYPASGATPAYQNSGTTWNLGATVTPNDVSAVALGYGYQQGSYSPSIQAGYALGPRTNISASYLVTVQNQLTSTLANQRFLSYDQFGNPVDSRTGLPFNAVNQTFGAQNTLFRDKPALLSISHQFERSNVTLTGRYEVRTTLTGPEMSDKTYSVTVNYSRDFTPLINGNFSVGYTDNISTGLGVLPSDVSSISLTASLFYRLSDTTTFNIIENYYKAVSNVPSSGSLTQQLTVGLAKSF